MHITRCLHTAVLVADVTRAAAFYDWLLQLPKVERPFNYAGVWYELGPIQFHLIEDQGYLGQCQNKDKLGCNPHVAFGVKNLNLLREKLDAQGCCYEMSRSGRRALFLQDPDGNVIELTEDRD